ncbi:ethanolaminephosphotransferase 1 isoform X2 [Pseudonaja textilis]|uniref:Ethanolaminephosphotransferase 1 n=2 Tax=Pseudonaja textilis TaxID=8673 RepID=A0A670YXE4_PSETE|nr:ethanolaminephosphotransferase 1 isoform X2 [Pseudonaja textilis]
MSLLTMAGYDYVSAEQLAGFDKYKYSAVDNNPLSLYVMHPFWNTVVKIFPKWLAPNLITFSGFLLLVFNFFLMAYFDPDFYASAPGQKHVPNKVWIIVGLLNFAAYTLDGVDGKQARRTQSSSPLGELFDHGLDSWACMFFVVTVYSTFGRGSNGVSVFVLYLLLWVVLFSFILSHWEKYNTGILFLPWGYDISQVTISVVYIVTSIIGVEAWYNPFLFHFLYKDLFVAMIIGCAFTVTIPMSLSNYYKAYAKGTLKHHSFYEAMLPFLSPVLLFILCTTWIFQSPTDILETHPRIFYFMVGTAFANISCQLIVSQMSSTRCQPLNWLLLPLALVILIVMSDVLPEQETNLLYLITIFITLAHIHYGVNVVRQLSKHFNIQTFSLQKPSSD